jgi:hypothetical protein
MARWSLACRKKTVSGVPSAGRKKQACGTINELLEDAGVDTSGIVLQEARAVSDNGHFIVGQGKFPEGTRAYIVRYDDGTTAG